MKRVLIATDSFKDSLSAAEVVSALAQGLSAHHPPLDIVALPLADGGEGSIDILSKVLDLRKESVPTFDPLMRPLEGYFYHNEKEAFIELAVASGISLLNESERNPLHTTTYGTGILIKKAMEQGLQTINLFIGSSATNDGGTGIAQALGFQFFDKDRSPLEGRGSDLVKIHCIDNQNVDPKLAQTTINVLCDVDNPFVGIQGAVATYSAQKGATDKDKQLLEEGMIQLSNVFQKTFGKDITSLSGAGAAGGVGGGAVAFLGAHLRRGVEVIFDCLKVENHVLAADIIITGEGRLDSQTKHGKVVAGISFLTKKYSKKLMVVCGQNTLPEVEKELLGIDQIIDLTSIAGSQELAMEFPEKYLIEATKRLVFKT